MVRVTEGVRDDDLKALYRDPYISRVGHDYRPASPIDHPLVTYLSAWVDDVFVGAFMAIQQTAIEIEVHALLKRKAIMRSRELGMAFIDWCFTKPIERITAWVIEGLESAKNYCLRLGFTFEGVRRSACIQNGSLKNLYMLGMTRQQWSDIK